MKYIPLYAILTADKYDNRTTYYQNAYSAQEAVNEIRKYYSDEFEKIIFVFKEVENWK